MSSQWRGKWEKEDVQRPLGAENQPELRKNGRRMSRWVKTGDDLIVKKSNHNMIDSVIPHIVKTL